MAFSELPFRTWHGMGLAAIGFQRWISSGTGAASGRLVAVGFQRWSTRVCVQRDHPVRYDMIVREL